jgi:hypothetical protein
VRLFSPGNLPYASSMRMKLVWISLSVAGLLVLALVLVALARPSPNAPRFVSLHSPPVGSYTWMDYDWGGAVPFRTARCG